MQYKSATLRQANFIRTCLLLGFFGSGVCGANETRHLVDTESGLSTWETEAHAVHLRLTEISPEQARAFMQARGLDEKSVEEFARTCVYMTVVRNEGKAPIRFSMSEWRYIPRSDTEADASSQVPHIMLGKHDWLAKWQPRKLPKTVRLAFEWSQFPFEQTFAPGDWNQGMTTYELPAGSRFDLYVRWHQNGKFREGVVRDVQCPASFD